MELVKHCHRVIVLTGQLEGLRDQTEMACLVETANIRELRWSCPGGAGAETSKRLHSVVDICFRIGSYFLSKETE